MEAEKRETPKSLNDVAGWFSPLDQWLFDWFMERQEKESEKGDLLEMGAYLGKSAILIGRHLREGETFTVCDLFDAPAPDEVNAEEMQRSYGSLTRRAFEANYLAFHERLPEIVEGPTSVITEHVESESCRFVHVDASHLYEHVHGDIAAARALLRPDGILVCDDYRSEHTPGVAAAVWGAVLGDGLNPVCVSGRKLYGTWGDPEPVRAELAARLAEEAGGLWSEVQQVAGHPIIRIKKRTTPRRSAAEEAKRAAAEEARLKEKLTATRERVKKLKLELRDSERQVRALRRSTSYRVGRTITAPPRAMRRMVKGS